MKKMGIITDRAVKVGGFAETHRLPHSQLRTLNHQPLGRPTFS